MELFARHTLKKPSGCRVYSRQCRPHPRACPPPPAPCRPCSGPPLLTFQVMLCSLSCPSLLVILRGSAGDLHFLGMCNQQEGGLRFRQRAQRFGRTACCWPTQTQERSGVLVVNQEHRGAGSWAQDPLSLSLRQQPESGTISVRQFWAGVAVQPQSTSGSLPVS